jgi:predicted HTH transcriptional regulator
MMRDQADVSQDLRVLEQLDLEAFDYERRGLVIHQHPHCITFANPGALRIGIDDAISGLSDPRNYTLVKLFNLIGVGERAGSGFPSIFEVWKTQDWDTPVIEEQFNPDRTILKLSLSLPQYMEVAINSSDNERKIAISDVQKQRIISYLTENASCKTSDLTTLLNVKEARARVLLSQLVDSGIVTKMGENRNRSYRLR